MTGGNVNGESTLSRDGVEVVSPILHSEDKSIPQKIQKVCGRLEGLGQEVSNRCGGHIHIGADYLQSAQSYSTLAEIVCNTEKILYAISNEPGQVVNEYRIKYIMPVSKKLQKAMKEENANIKQILKRSQGYSDKPIDWNKKRYYGINFLNIDETKHTIEFRMPNGTLDPNTWIENINLFAGIIKASQELALIQEKPDKEKTSKDRIMLQLLQSIKSKDIDEEDKLIALLGLCVKREDKATYISRYITNNRLLKQSVELNDFIDKYISEEPINFDYNNQAER